MVTSHAIIRPGITSTGYGHYSSSRSTSALKNLSALPAASHISPTQHARVRSSLDHGPTQTRYFSSRPSTCSAVYNPIVLAAGETEKKPLAHAVSFRHPASPTRSRVYKSGARTTPELSFENSSRPLQDSQCLGTTANSNSYSSSSSTSSSTTVYYLRRSEAG